MDKNAKYIVLISWVFLTGLNLNKAFHIDDTFHLEAAMQIAEDVFHPMSAKVNWNDSSVSLYNHNQPPLYFYMIALMGNLFGFKEIYLHLFQSIFTFLCLRYFFLITRFLKLARPAFLLILFASNTALIVNQNLMVDVPLLAFILMATYYILKAEQTGSTKSYLLSIVIATLALFIKYSILPFFLFLVVLFVLRKRWTMLLGLFIPIIAISGWILWNQWEFGNAHLLTRPTSQLGFNLFQDFLATLGGLSPFVGILLYWAFKWRHIEKLFYTSVFLGGASMLLSSFGIIELSAFNLFLKPSLLIIGYIVFICLIIAFFIKIKNQKLGIIEKKEFPLWLILSMFSIFIITSPQFIASRHLLLIVPFILLVMHEGIKYSSKNLIYTTTILSIVYGVALGYSDWQYANFYRDLSRKTEQLVSGRVWSQGHWGWQWYSQVKGFDFYDSKNELAVEKGDFVVYPLNVPKQKISNRISYEIIDTLTQDASKYAFLSTKNASLYNSNVNNPIWQLSKGPVDTILIAIVTKQISMQDEILRIKSDPSWQAILKSKALENDMTIDEMIPVAALWLKREAEKTRISNKKNYTKVIK